MHKKSVRNIKTPQVWFVPLL